jgi:hypothetical protein
MQVLFVTILVKESTSCCILLNREAQCYFYISHFRYVVKSLAKGTMGVLVKKRGRVPSSTAMFVRVN